MPQFFIDRPVFAWVVALAISLAGLLAIPNLPVSQYPEVAPPSVTINANYPGASVDDVAESVASIIENELNGAKGLLYYESVSDSYGRAQITATFEPGTDPDMALVECSVGRRQRHHQQKSRVGLFNFQALINYRSRQ